MGTRGLVRSDRRAHRSAQGRIRLTPWKRACALAGSLKFGHATASLLVDKLSASGRQNALAAALEKYGAIRRGSFRVSCRGPRGPALRHAGCFR
nr:transposase [Nocardia uniformis]